VKWEKLGKIFDPADYKLSSGCTEFAKSPQALVFDNYVRIYFSSQKRTDNGKYVSHIQFVDMTLDFSSVIAVSTQPVIALGGLGSFDEHGIFPMNTVRHDNKIYAYTSGWSRRVSVSIDMAIGLAISHDGGSTFQKFGEGPVLTASVNEPFLVGDPFVRIIGGQFHMWYIFGTEWRKFSEGSDPDRIYKIGHAISLDGIHWSREGQAIVANKYNDESQALPSVLKLGDEYHMLFAYRKSFDFRDNKENGYRIGYAHSKDLSTWARDDRLLGIDVSESGWDSEMMCYPNIFKCNNAVYLLYNGNAFGRHGFGLAKLAEN
jgi:predicted GH43/DUF377 family glycosyl hydrolase